MEMTPTRRMDRFVNSLRFRIQAVFIVFTIIVFIGGGLASYFTIRSYLITENFNKLTALRDTRANQLQQWFAEQRIDVEAFSKNPLVIQAVQDFHNAINTEGGASYNQIRNLYLGQSTLTDAGDGSAYSRVHAQYFTDFQDILLTYGYTNLLLVDKEGNVIFSVAKEDDFGTNLSNGPYATTNLARAFSFAVI